jgi:hypothetical protein
VINSTADGTASSNSVGISALGAAAAVSTATTTIADAKGHRRW